MFSQQVFAVRQDLVVRPIRQGTRNCWVVKDPISRKFFYFNEQEYAIFAWLDGTCSVQTIIARFCRKFPPVHLSPAQLSEFLSELARADLLKGTTGTTSGSRDSSFNHPLAQRLGEVVGNPLAIRLPGVNPSRFLDMLAPGCQWMFSKSVLALAGLLILLALACALVQFENLAAAVPQLRAAGTSQVLMTIAVSLIVSKIIHELAHALTARHFGVRCESMGVLLLIFTPCLYCDVSDAWLLASRRARIAISAAGIFAELVLASIATLLWMISRDDPTRAVLLTVMIVCSVNTLLFNGNPLMRYDGYFILSDLLGMPNLAGESAARITSRLRSWIWGERPGIRREETTRERLLLWSYGLLSAGYRLILIMVILYGVDRYFDRIGLRLLGMGLAGLVLTTFVTKTTTNLLRPPAGSAVWGINRFKRPALALGCLLLMLAGLLLVPIPRPLHAPFRIESRQSRDVYVPIAGQLVWAAQPGQIVRAGDLLAELRNPALDLELQKIDLQLDLLRSRLHSLDARRGLLNHANERPALIESISSLKKKRTVLAREKQELAIHSPLNGVIHDPPNLLASPTEIRSVSFWTGTPLEPRNRNCYLPQGTHLCSITGESEKRAVLYLGQQHLQHVRTGQAVRLWLPGISRNGLDAKVIEIAPAPLDEIPREFLAKNVIALNPASSPGTMRPQEPLYRVVAQITTTNVPLPLRATGQAGIRTTPVTLWKFLRESAHASFRF